MPSNTGMPSTDIEIKQDPEATIDLHGDVVTEEQFKAEEMEADTDAITLSIQEELDRIAEEVKRDVKRAA